MNRVHEQCPKNLTQENTESNRAKNRSSAPSAQPKPSPRAQAARPAPSQPCPARSASAPRACRAPRAPAARPLAQRPALSTCCTPNAVSWPCVRAGMAVSWPASRHSAQPPSRPATIQYFVLQLTSSPTKHLSHNWIAIQLLTYCTPLATQPFLLQYNFPSSQYKMGSSPSRFFCTKNLFYFFFHLFPEIGKKKSLKIIFFFIFHNTSNNFIKIYFLHFSSILHHIKP